MGIDVMGDAGWRHVEGRACGNEQQRASFYPHPVVAERTATVACEPTEAATVGASKDNRLPRVLEQCTQLPKEVAVNHSAGIVVSRFEPADRNEAWVAVSQIVAWREVGIMGHS